MVMANCVCADAYFCNLICCSKLSSVVVSQFASAFVFHWNDFFPKVKMIYPPAFDSRVIAYPSDDNLRDYLSWRQADCKNVVLAISNLVL